MKIEGTVTDILIERALGTYLIILLGTNEVENVEKEVTEHTSD
jgi:hypothetical protein